MVFLLLLAGKIQLVPDGTLLLHVFLILLMVAILNATLFKPINKILAERDATTRGRISEAEATVKSVKEKLAQYEAERRDARSQGYSAMEQERLNSLREREEKVAALRAEISSWSATEKEGLARESQRARQELENEAQALGVQIATQIMGRPVSTQ